MSCVSISSMYRFWPAVFGVTVFFPNDRVRPCSNMPRGDSCGSSVATRISDFTSALESNRPCRVRWLYSSTIRTAWSTLSCSPSTVKRVSCSVVRTCSESSSSRIFSSRVPKKGSIFPVMCIVRLIHLEGCSALRNGCPMGVPLKISNCCEALVAQSLLTVLLGQRKRGQTPFNVTHPRPPVKLHPCNKCSAGRVRESCGFSLCLLLFSISSDAFRVSSFDFRRSPKTCPSHPKFRARYSCDLITCPLVRQSYGRKPRLRQNSSCSVEILGGHFMREG